MRFFLSLLLIIALICPVHADSSQEVLLNGSPFSDLIRQISSENETPIPEDGVYRSAHFVQMQNLGSDALACRLHLFRHVQKTLDILTYIWNDDQSGKFMMREAVKAAERGVKVRIMIDTIGTPEDLAMMTYFATAHPNLQVKIYNPVSYRVLPSAFHLYRELIFKFRKFNQRMHTKLIIADGKVAITGGRNFGDEYFDLNDGHNFKDRDILVVGPMLKELQTSFESFWVHQRAAWTTDLIDVKQEMRRHPEGISPEGFYHFGNMFDDVEHRSEDDAYIRRRFVDTAMRVDHLMLVMDPPGKKKRKTLRNVNSRATIQLLSVVSQAKHSIALQSPYFILDARGIKLVRDHLKANPGLDMMMSTNSLAATDSVYAYSYAFKQHKTYVCDLKIRVFELKPIRTQLYTMKYLKDLDSTSTGYDPYLPELRLKEGDYYGSDNEQHMSVHAKSFVIDDQIGWIGSTNLDARSFHWNTEIGIVVWDQNFAQALKQDMLWDMSPANSWVVARRKSGWNFLRRASEPTGTLMEYIPVLDFWPFHYTSSFDLKKGETPVAANDSSFYDHYRDVGSFPQVGTLAKRRWRLRILKPLIGSVEPVL